MNVADEEMEGFWTHPGDKLTIGTVDGAMMQVAAQYNPKELGFSASASWTQPNDATGGKSHKSTRIEYATSESRTLTIELLFDGYEKGTSVEKLVQTLEDLMKPQPALSRPPLCVAVWGDARPFRCVVQSVATKLTMFKFDGTPLRAICTVTLKEVDAVGMLAAGDEKLRTRSAIARSKRARELLGAE